MWRTFVNGCATAILDAPRRLKPKAATVTANLRHQVLCHTGVSSPAHRHRDATFASGTTAKRYWLSVYANLCHWGREYSQARNFLQDRRRKPGSSRIDWLILGPVRPFASSGAPWRLAKAVYLC